MSMRKRRIVFTQFAEQEYSDLLLFSLERWGKRQQQVYKRTIQAALRRIANQPFSGKLREEFSPGLRSVPVGSHIIYYWVFDDRIVIARILYQRRNAEDIDWATLDPGSGP